MFINRKRISASKVLTPSWTWPANCTVMFTHAAFSKKRRPVSESQMNCLIQNATSDRHTALLLRALCNDTDVYLSLEQAERVLNLFESQAEQITLIETFAKSLRCPHMAVKLYISRRDRLESSVRISMLRSLLSVL